MAHSLQLLLLLALAIGVAKTGGALATRIHQPAVFGDILVGLILGPTVLDVLGWPAFTATVDSPIAPGASLNAFMRDLAELDVLLLMFVAGLETDLDEMRRVGTVAFWSAFGDPAARLRGAHRIGLRLFALLGRDLHWHESSALTSFPRP